MRKLKTAIAIEKYKQGIFERRLKEANFEFETGPGLTDDTLTISVETIRMLELSKLISLANHEARRWKMN